MAAHGPDAIPPGGFLVFDEDDFFAARVTDPEGNVFEIYWDKR